MQTDSLYSEVRSFIQDRLDAGVILRSEWVITEFLADKAVPDCEDADFYLLCASSHVAEVVKKCIGKYKSKPVSDAQLVLTGFEYMQKAYQVERAGVRLLVPTDLLTDDELDARADEYEAMAVGCRAHAREIRAFKEGRSRTALGAA